LTASVSVFSHTTSQTRHIHQKYIILHHITQIITIITIITTLHPIQSSLVQSNQVQSSPYLYLKYPIKQYTILYQSTWVNNQPPRRPTTAVPSLYYVKWDAVSLAIAPPETAAPNASANYRRNKVVMTPIPQLHNRNRTHNRNPLPVFVLHPWKPMTPNL